MPGYAPLSGVTCLSDRFPRGAFPFFDGLFPETKSNASSCQICIHPLRSYDEKAFMGRGDPIGASDGPYGQRSISYDVDSEDRVWTVPFITSERSGWKDFVDSSCRRSEAQEGITMKTEKMAFLLACLSAFLAVTHSYELHGSGTSNPSKYIWRVFDLLQVRAKEDVRMTYRSVGSGVGQTEFEGQNNGMKSYNAFGCGDIPLSNEKYEAIRASGRVPLQLPFVVGAISIFHSVPGLDSDSQFLQLSPCVVAKIFSRKITKWNDPEIVAENPQVEGSLSTGETITVLGRIRGSSSTASLTGYLHEACPEEWTESMVGSTVQWDSSVVTQEDSDGMSNYLKANPYAIAYIEAFHGRNLRLSEVKLRNKAGNYVNSQEANVARAASEAFEAGIMPNSSEASWADVEIFNQDGNNTWPIAAISYFYVDKDLTSLESSGRLLQAFLRFIVSEEGGEIAEFFGFAALPSDVKSVYNQALDDLMLDADSPEWNFETPDETLPGIGSKDFYFSGKRQTYAEYDRDVLTSSVLLLEEQLETLQQKYNALVDSNSDGDGDGTSGTAIAALVISIVAMLTSGFLLYMAIKPTKAWQKTAVPSSFEDVPY